MTTLDLATDVTPDSSLDTLRARYRPVFDRIAEGAVEREKERILPFEQVGWLRESGFTAVTVPSDLGGQGASIEQLFDLLVDLAEADSNLPQILRAHFAFIEQAQTLLPPEQGDQLLASAASGTIFGNASHERGAARVGDYSTTAVRQSDGSWLLNGTKAYSTGSLFADAIFVPASTQDGPKILLVPSPAPGVELVDDWDGFGQRLTGSGTTVFTDVRLDPGAALDLPLEVQTHLTAFVQLVLLSVLAGISRAAVRDAVQFVRGRTRVYSHGVGSTAASDPLVQHVVGRLSALSFAAESAVQASVAKLRAAHEAVLTSSSAASVAIEAAELAAVRGQLAVIDLVLPLTSQLFDIGGASATSIDRQLDRHWRNARTVSSHNPSVYQARLIGDHLINGAPLQYFWATGESTPETAAATADSHV